MPPSLLAASWVTSSCVFDHQDHNPCNYNTFFFVSKSPEKYILQIRYLRIQFKNRLENLNCKSGTTHPFYKNLVFIWSLLLFSALFHLYSFMEAGQFLSRFLHEGSVFCKYTAASVKPNMKMRGQYTMNNFERMKHNETVRKPTPPDP